MEENTPIRCQVLGHRYDDELHEAVGVFECTRCGWAGYSAAPPTWYDAISGWWWRRVSSPYHGLWGRLRRRFVRCRDCGRTLHNCTCLPF